MKSWIVLAIIVGLLVFAGITLIVNSKSVQADETTQGACLGAAGCSYKDVGGCTQGANCGASTCAVNNGGSCGCGAK